MTQYCIYCGAKLQELQKFCMRCGRKVLTDEELESLEVSEPEIPREPKLMVFISYATKDVDLYKIRNIAEKLSEFDEIEDVLYWQEDMHDNIYKYMNDNLGKCDVVLLFCSANALSSVPVEKEWTAADSLGKPIIPIFMNTDDIPPLLSSRLGVEFDAINFHETIQELYGIIIKKTIENVELKSQLKYARKERNYLIILK